MYRAETTHFFISFCTNVPLLHEYKYGTKDVVKFTDPKAKKRDVFLFFGLDFGIMPT